MVKTSQADARIDSLERDPVGHLRQNLTTWIAGAPEETIRQLLKIRKNLDSNFRKPLPPAGWRPIRPLAAELQIDAGHLARQCRDLYAAQELARLCTLHGRQTWCLSPACAESLRATHAPHATAPVPASPSGEPALSSRNTDLPAPAAPLEVTP